MSLQLKLKKRLQKIFNGFSEQQNWLDIQPENPLKMVDEAEKRCYSFFDCHGVNFLTLTFSEVKCLPQHIRKYFMSNQKEREKIALAETLKVVRKTIMTVDDMIATNIIVYLSTWTFCK